jgi:hypothetical protein
VEPRISLITFGVKDLQASLAFYRDGLHWTPSKASAGDVVFFQMNGMAFALFPRQTLADDAHVDNDGTGFSGIAVAHNVRSEAEVDQTLDRARQAGARIVKPAQKAEWGGYSGYFADPDGYLWEIAYNPFFPLDAAGNLTLP